MVVAVEVEEFSYVREMGSNGKRLVPLSYPLSYMSYDYNAGVRKHPDKKASRFAELAELCTKVELPNMVCQTAGMYLHRFLDGYYGRFHGIYKKLIPKVVIYIATSLHRYPLPLDDLFNSPEEAKKGKWIILKIVYKRFIPVEKVSIIKNRDDEAIAIINKYARKVGLTEADILRATHIVKEIKANSGTSSKTVALVAIFAAFLTRMKYYSIVKLYRMMNLNGQNYTAYIEVVGE